jgi:AcrR family transcriptional regulator
VRILALTGDEKSERKPVKAPNLKVRNDKTHLTSVKRRVGRPKRSVQASGDSTRKFLLDAALEMFASVGYDATSTAEIARRAGMAQSIVHYHFRSKDDIWKEAMTHMMRQRGPLLPPTTDDLKDLGPVERLRVMTRQLIRISQSDSR